MTHMHITSWVLLLILFIVSLMMYNQGKGKPAKIVHMILRLDYLFILYTGGALLADYLANSGMPILAEAITKGLAGIWLIVATEMILVRTNKGKSTKGLWVQFVIALLLTLILGLWRLPLGIQL
ncbi:YisL family protein [Virgibacillus ainsalahensis]